MLIGDEFPSILPILCCVFTVNEYPQLQILYIFLFKIDALTFNECPKWQTTYIFLYTLVVLCSVTEPIIFIMTYINPVQKQALI